MSGVFGLIRPTQSDSIAGGLERMAAALRLHAWAQARTCYLPDDAVGLGQVNIGVFSAQEGIAFSADRRVAAAAFGWARNAARLRARLEKTGPAPVGASEAALALHLYEECGPGMAAEMEGEFVAAVWDARRRHLLLTNDRNGLYPLYYARLSGGGLAFAPTIGALLAAGDIPRRLNLDSAAEYLRFQRILGYKTFFQDIHALPYASYLEYDARSGDLTCRHYWDYNAVPDWPELSFADTVAETGRLMRAAVDQAMTLPQRKGVFLSGGMDSRTLLGFAGQGRPALPSLTYGHPDSTDVRYALRLARLMGSTNRYVPQMDGKFLLDYVDLHLQVSGGQVPFIHAHSGSALAAGREWMQVNLMGHVGDHLLGGVLRDGGSYLAARTTNRLAFQTLLFTLFNQEYCWPGINEPEERVLYTPDYDRLLRGRAFDSLIVELAPFERYAPQYRLNAFTLAMTYNQAYIYNEALMRTHFEVVNPFCDYRLQDFLLTVPYDYRLDDRLYLALINREIPRATLVPRDKDDLLPTTHPLLRGLDWARLKIERRLPFRKRASQQLHGDPETWLREDLRQWVAGVLFDRRTLERGIFNPDFLRSIFDRHMAANEIWTVGKLAHLVSFELMLRRFFDGSAPGK